MAKKKSSATSNQSKQEQQIQPQTLDQQQTVPIPAMNDQSEKLHSLKSLNSILLKETHERRLQVDALVQTNKHLESELTRLLSEKNVAESEFAKVTDEKAALELEYSSTNHAMETQIDGIRFQLGQMTEERDGIRGEFAGLMKEMAKVKCEGEFQIAILKKKVDELTGDVAKERGVSSSVLCERDELKDELEVRIKEVSALRENAVEMVCVEERMAEEARKLKTGYEGSLRKSMEMLNAMQALTKEKESIDEKLVDTVRINDDLKRGLEEVTRVKEGMEEERNRQAVEIRVLEKNVNELIGTVKGLKDIEEELKRTISGLEMSNSEGVESRKQLLAEFNILQEQKVEFEKKTEKLLDENVASMRQLEALEKKLDDQKQHIGCLVREKSDIEEDRNRQVIMIKELEKQLGDLSEVVMTLRDVEADLNAKISEMQESNAEVVESREQILIESTDLKRRNVESARQIESLLEEKSFNLRSLELLEKKLEAQNLHIEALVRDKTEVEEGRKMKALKIKELEKEVSELSEIVSTLRDVEMGLNLKISELEKCLTEGVESREHLLIKIAVLQEHKEEGEKKLEVLLGENRANIQTLETLEKKVEEQKQHIEIVVRDKTDIEDMQLCSEKKIAELQKELGRLNDTVVTLQQTCTNQEDEMKKLLIDISQYTLQIGRITNERDDVAKDLKMEKDNLATLLLRVLEMEKKLDVSSKQIEQMKMENVKAAEVKEEAEKRCETLAGQNSLIQNKLNDVQAKLESKCDSSKWVLSVLRNTAELVSSTFGNEMKGREDDLLSNVQKYDEEEVKPYMVELELIKEAFKSKETKLDELKRQLEFLQNSMVEVRKKKNFWTLFSSATLFAAASVAYVTRGN